MHSSIYGKVEKSMRYAQQPDRVSITSLTLTFHGEHDDHHVSLVEQHWHCDCHSFEALGACAHIMATERLLDPMLPREARVMAPVDMTPHA